LALLLIQWRATDRSLLWLKVIVALMCQVVAPVASR
jgi:hypothetical protein